MASKTGWLAIHYVARFHGTADRSLALLRAVGGEESLTRRSRTGWLPAHLLSRHATSPSALKAILTQQTAMETAPGGLTALALLCKHQPALHEAVRVGIEVQPRAARVRRH